MQLLLLSFLIPYTDIEETVERYRILISTQLCLIEIRVCTTLARVKNNIVIVKRITVRYALFQAVS